MSQDNTIRLEWYRRDDVCKLLGVCVGAERAAAVYQNVDVETMEWGQPTVTIGRAAMLDPQLARAHAAAIVRACEIAEAWERGEKAKGEP